MQNSQETLILYSDLLSSAWSMICSLWSKTWVSIHMVSTSNGCIHWWKISILFSQQIGFGLFFPCDIVYFHPSPIPAKIWGWEKGCKGYFCEGQQSWAEILTCAHVYAQIIWVVDESGFWVIPTLKYQWGCTSPRNVEICWFRRDVSSSHIRNLQI